MIPPDVLDRGLRLTRVVSRLLSYKSMIGNSEVIVKRGLSQDSPVSRLGRIIVTRVSDRLDPDARAGSDATDAYPHPPPPLPEGEGGNSLS